MLPFPGRHELCDEVMFVALGALEEEEEFLRLRGKVDLGGFSGHRAESWREEGASEEVVHPGGHVSGDRAWWPERHGEAVEGGEFCVWEEVAMRWEAGVAGVAKVVEWRFVGANGSLGVLVAERTLGEGDDDVGDPITVLRVDFGANCSKGRRSEAVRCRWDRIALTEDSRGFPPSVPNHFQHTP